MAFDSIQLDRNASLILLVAGLLLVGFLGLALTGTVAADAGHEASACMSRFA